MTTDVTSVEALVRTQLATALGGRRGMVEAALPTLTFTVTWLVAKDLRTALILSLAVAGVLLMIRLVQRSSIQFVVNALVGIGIGWLFVSMAARSGASEQEQALAYFLPGILYNAGYAVVMAFTVLIGWPLVGFMVGSVTGDPTAWHADNAVVKLTALLTWLLAAPCVLRVAVQAPVWLAGRSGSLDPEAAVAILGVSKIALGWPLQLLTLAVMVWVLSRNHTPLERPDDSTEESTDGSPAAADPAGSGQQPSA